jgi:delta-aminolevulinic acid dehydratase/porphobilinogen synthase
MMAQFPTIRMRRTRQNDTLRNLVRETTYLPTFYCRKY